MLSHFCRAYSHENIAEGKEAAKAELRRRMDLSSADVPLVSVVTRLTHQKGIHLIKHAAWRTLERGGQFVLLGSAPDPRVQVRFECLDNDSSVCQECFMTGKEGEGTNLYLHGCCASDDIK